MQAASARIEYCNYKSYSKQQKRNRIADEVSQERAAEADFCSIRTQQSQSGGPLAESQSRQAGKNAEVQYRGRYSQENADRFR